MAFLGEHQARRQWAGAAVALAGTAAIAAAVFLGVAPSAAGFALWAYAMARMDVGRATLSLYLVPAAAILISLIWLSQLPGPVELAGGAVALGGVVLASSKARQRAEPPYAVVLASSKGRPRAQAPDGVARAEGVEARPVQKI